MGYTVKVQHPHFPEGTVFNVGGLDRIPNGSSVDVDDEAERLFIMTQGQTIEDAFANDAVVDVSGSSALDPGEVNSLIEAYGPAPAAEETETDSATDTPAWMNNPPETTDTGESNA